MGVFKEIAKADGSGTTTFYRLSSEEDTVETTSTDGTSTMIDYNSMLNKPSINDVALVGNKTLEDLGIQPAGDYLTAVPEEYITEEELEAKDYATETFVMEQINNTEHFHREIVDALPLIGKDNVLYLVPKKGSDKDIYNEYIWTGADYEFMGTTAVDLTDYYKKSEVDGLLDTKVNKVSGKQLSTNDYTTAEKTKLASLENYDDSELRSKVDALHNYDDTVVKLDIQELKRDTSTNEIDIASIENELGYKAEVIRLVKNGDWWLCQDAKGNNLTLEMAMNRLGLPKTILLLENLENDGKYYPVEYRLQEKYIDIIYKDLDGITHHLNYGYNEYFTNTASGDYIHLEDSINYPYKELSVDGVCEQETTRGVNLTYISSKSDYNYSSTLDGDMVIINGTSTQAGNVAMHLNGSEGITLKANETYTVSIFIEGTVTGGTYRVIYLQGTSIGDYGSNKIVRKTITPTEDKKCYMISFDISANQVFTNMKVRVQIEKGDIGTDYEPYTGRKPSPNPDYPQEIRTIKNSISVKSIGKNLTKVNDFDVNVNNYYYQNNFILENFKNNTTYTLSFDVICSKEPFSMELGYGNDYYALSIYGTYLGNQYNGHKKITFTTNNNNYKNLFVRVPRFSTQETYTANVTNIMLVAEDTEQNYEPYKESSITANLPEGEFIGKINDTYKDTLKVEYNEEDGNYHLNLYKSIAKVVLDGSENWKKSNNDQQTINTNLFYLDDIRTISKLKGITNVISNKFITRNVVGSSNDFIGISGSANLNNVIYIRINQQLTAQEFKTWLSTNNTDVYYALAEPYVVDLGIVDMPTTYDSITNLYTDNDLLPTINIEYYTEILENAKDNIIGQDIYLQDEVDTLNDLPTEANKGDIRKVKDTESWYIYDGVKWSAFDKASEIDLTNYLSKDNTIPYAPSADYNPATKRYVDTKINDLFIPTKTSQLTNDSGFVLKSVNDLANYYNKSNTYNKAEVNALVAGGSGGSNVSITVNGDTLVITTK